MPPCKLQCVRVCRGEAGHKPLVKHNANKTNKRQRLLGGQLANNHRAQIAASLIESSSSSDEEAAPLRARRACLTSSAPTFVGGCELRLADLPDKSKAINNVARR